MRKEQKRHLVLPVEFTERSDAAVKYAIEHLWREGDVFNLVHVCKASESTTEIFHGTQFAPPLQVCAEIFNTCAFLAAQYRCLRACVDKGTRPKPLG